MTEEFCAMLCDCGSVADSWTFSYSGTLEITSWCWRNYNRENYSSPVWNE